MSRLVKELRRFGRDTMGASAVELAFVMPVLMLLIVGTLDGGRAMLAVNQLAKISKEGARYASVHGSEAAVPATQASVTDFVKDRATATGLEDAKLSVNVVWEDAAQNPGTKVTVQVAYQYASLLGGLMPFADFDFNSQSSLSIMR